LTYDLEFKVCEAVKYTFVQNVIRLRAAVHELSGSETKKTRTKQYNPSLARLQ